MRKQYFTAVFIALSVAATLAFAPARQQSGQQQSTPQRSDESRRGAAQDDRQQPAAQMRARMKEREPAARVRGKQPATLALVTSPTRITSNPAQFYGVPVSVHAQVARSYNPHVFTVEPDGGWSLGQDLIVFVPSPRPGASLQTSDYVTVVGTVRPFVRADIERDYDWFDADGLPDLNVNLEGRPVLVADVARTSAGVALAQPSQQTTRILVATAGDIADVPGRFYGHPVSVAAEVEDVWSPHAFTLDEDRWFAGPDVLVFNPAPVSANGSLDGKRVRVLGVVRPFVESEFEADYDWFDAADYRSRGMLDRRPVIVASSILDDNNNELVRFQPDLAVDVVVVELAPRAEQWAKMRQGRASSRPAREERPTTGQQQPGAPQGR